MKKIYLLLFLLIPYQYAIAEIPTKPVSSSIERVTVFLTGAQVNRLGATSLQPGTTALLFGNIAADIQTQSIQVSAEGNFTVQSVVHQLNYLNEQKKDEQIDLLENARTGLQDQLDIENNLLQVYIQEEQVLQANKSIGGQNQGVNITQLKEAADFYRSRLSEIKLKQLEIGKTIRTLKADLAKTDNQLQALHAQSEGPTGEIVVTVSCKLPTAAKFKISYLVNNAGWHPTYDIRVKDINNPVALMYKANVFQQSGEDWKDVKLTISTGNPHESGSKPILSPWYLGFYNPYYADKTSDVTLPAMAGINIRQLQGRIIDTDGSPLPGASVHIKGASLGTVTDANGHYFVQLPANASVVVVSYIGYITQELPINAAIMNFTLQPDIQSLSEVVVTGYGASGTLNGAVAGVSVKKKQAQREESIPVNATLVRNQTQAEFSIDLPYTIPTDGKQYAVDMKEYTIPAGYEYYCTPKLEGDAFLLARIIDWEEYNLLAGEANLFFEGTYLGKSLLDVSNMSDTLTLSLGRDKNIVVSRTKLKSYTGKQFIGNNKKEIRAYEISIRNKKAQPVTINIEDQFPVSNNKEIEVTRLQSSGAEAEKDTGKVSWRLQLEPAQTKKLTLTYEVKYPKNEKVLLE